MLLSVGGMTVIFDGNITLALRQMTGVTGTALNNFTFGVVPLFVLTGLLVSAADFGREAFEVAEWDIRENRRRTWCCNSRGKRRVRGHHGCIPCFGGGVYQGRSPANGGAVALPPNLPSAL